MQHRTQRPSAQTFRRERRLAVASLLAAHGQRAGVRDRHRQPRHRSCAGTTRSATTSACARRTQDPTILGSPELRRRRPQLRQRLARHQPARRAVRVRPRLADAATAFARERRRLVRLRLRQPRQHQRRDRQHAGQRPAGRGRAQRRTPSATPRARRARCSTRSCSRNFDARRCAGQRQGRASTRSTGATACCWAARSTASPTRRTRSTSGRASPRRAARRRSSSGRAAASRCRRSRPRTCRSRRSGSTTGRRCASPESGSYLTVQRRAQLRRRLVHLRAATRSPRRFRARRPTCGCGTRPAMPTSRYSAQPRRLGHLRALEPDIGSTARSASTTATRPTSCRSRWRRRASLRVPAATCTAIGGVAAAGGTLCIVNPNATTVADLQQIRQGRHLPRRPTATTSTSTA